MRERLISRLEKTRSDLVAKAYKLRFSVGFEKCKKITLTHLPTGSAEFLRTDQSDENLKSIICFCLGKFVSMFDIIMGTNKIDSAMQTEEVEVGEGLSEMDC